MGKKGLLMSLICLLISGGELFAAEGIIDKEIKLGMVNAQTGPASGLGKGMFSGADAFFKEVNAKGGISGRKINLIG